MANEEELLAIRMELRDQAKVVTGIKEVVGAEKGLGSQTEKTGKAAEKSAKHTDVLGKAYSTMGAKAKFAFGILGVSGAFAIEKGIHNTEELAKTTSGLVRNFDLQNNVASRWGAIAYGRDIDTKALGMTFGTLSTKLTTAAREGGKALLPFHQLGLTQEDAAKGAHNFEWGIMRVAKALGEEEGGAKRAAAAKALLGKGSATLLPLFAEGAEGLRENLHLADEYGVTLSGSATEGIMEMVASQRELKIAQLGLQVSMTKALMPAIEAGEDQVKEFIKTLNDPDLTAEQKTARIAHQFLTLENDLFRILESMAPHIADQAGKLGLKLAGSLWHAFINSDPLGKLIIGGWLLTKMGGLPMIGSLGAKVGGKLASSLGWKFLETVAPYFAAEVGVEGLGAALGSQMGGLKTLFAGNGKILGAAMGLAAAGALAAEIKFAIDERENLFQTSLFFTPKLDATSREDEATKLTDQGYTGIGFGSGGTIEAVTPGGKHVTFDERGGKWSVVKGGKGGGQGKDGRGRGRHEDLMLPVGAGASSSAPRPQHIHIHIGSKEVAEVVADEARNAEDLG